MTLSISHHLLVPESIFLVSAAGHTQQAAVGAGMAEGPQGLLDDLFGVPRHSALDKVAQSTTRDREAGNMETRFWAGVSLTTRSL